MHPLDRNGALGVEKCKKELADRIEKLPLPLDLKRAFQWNWATKSARINKYRFEPLENAFSCEYFDRLLAARMIEICTALNGDPVVVHFTREDCEVGILEAVKLAGEENAAPLDFYVKVCGSLDELLFRLAENMFLPIDYYSACNLHELKKTMPENEPIVP
jgi:hypothetical protein